MSQIHMKSFSSFRGVFYLYRGIRRAPKPYVGLILENFPLFCEWIILMSIQWIFFWINILDFILNSIWNFHKSSPCSAQSIQLMLQLPRDFRLLRHRRVRQNSLWRLKKRAGSQVLSHMQLSNMNLLLESKWTRRGKSLWRITVFSLI